MIHEKFEEKLHTHIKVHLEEDFGCGVRTIGGAADHVHILFLLDPNHALKDIMKNIKGESSHWVNELDLTQMKFLWQVGYGAFSVSESNVKVVEEYIKNQKEHHKKLTFLDEYRAFMAKNGLQCDPETVETV